MVGSHFRREVQRKRRYYRCGIRQRWCIEIKAEICMFSLFEACLGRRRWVEVGPMQGLLQRGKLVKVNTRLYLILVDLPLPL